MDIIVGDGAGAYLREQAFSEIESTDDVGKALLRIRDLYELKHVAYHAARMGARPDSDPFVRTSYPAEWIKRYLQQGYIQVDPVVREGFKRTLPFDWSEFVAEDLTEMSFFRDAAAHGIGMNGMSIPLVNKRNLRGLLSVSSDCSEEDWKAYTAKFTEDLMEIGHVLHRRVTSEHFSSEEDKPALSAREAECLHWVSNGKDSGDIAVILALSEHTVRHYLKSVRHKLGCATLAQCVHRAMQLGILRD